ncbi:hypothetical protein ABK040_008794 [Willaertia magna]
MMKEEFQQVDVDERAEEQVVEKRHFHARQDSSTSNETSASADISRELLPSENEYTEEHQITEENKVPIIIDSAFTSSDTPKWKKFVGDWRKTVMKLSFTLSYFLIMFLYGFCSSIIGPTLPKISEHVKTSVDDMGWIFTCKGIGSIVGALFVGKAFDIMFEKLSRTSSDSNCLRFILRNIVIHTTLSLFVVLISVCLIVIPFVPVFGLLLFIYLVFGVAMGSLNIAVNILCFRIWKEKASSVLLLLCSVSGLGAFVCPMLVNSLIKGGLQWQFTFTVVGCALTACVIPLMLVQTVFRNSELFEEEEIETSELKQSASVESVETADDFNNIQSEELELELGRVKSEESITSVSPISPIDQPENQQLRQDDTSRIKKITLKLISMYQQSKGLRACLLIGCILFGCVGLESSFGGLLVTFLKNKKISAGDEEISFMISMFWLSMTIGRLVSAVVLYVINLPQLIILGSILGCFTSTLLFLVCPVTNVTAWISTVLMGVAISAIFPTTLAFPASKMTDVKLTGKLTSLIFVISSAGEMVIPILITKAIGIIGLFYVLMSVTVFMVITSIVLFVMAFKKNNSSEERKNFVGKYLKPLICCK